MSVIAFYALILLASLLLSGLLLPLFQLALTHFWPVSPSQTLFLSTLLLTAIGLARLLTRLRLTSRGDLGLARQPHGCTHAVLQGMLLGMLMLIGLTGLLLILGIRVTASNQLIALQDMLQTASMAIVSGLLIATLQEFFFRGPLHSAMRRSLSFWPTAVLTSTLFTLALAFHPTPLPQSHLGWLAGLHSVLGGLTDLAHLNGHVDHALSIWLAGLFLSMLRERTGSILWGIGMHAGWLTILHIASDLTDVAGSSQLGWLVSNDGFSGWIASLCLLLLSLIYWRNAGRERRPQT